MDKSYSMRIACALFCVSVASTIVGAEKGVDPKGQDYQILTQCLKDNPLLMIPTVEIQLPLVPTMRDVALAKCLIQKTQLASKVSTAEKPMNAEHKIVDDLYKGKSNGYFKECQFDMTNHPGLSHFAAQFATKEEINDAQVLKHELHYYGQNHWLVRCMCKKKMQEIEMRSCHYEGSYTREEVEALKDDQ